MAAAMQPTQPTAGMEPPEPPPVPAVQAAFPHLEILQFIGQGGMGWVFKARQPKLNRLVALKLLPASLAGRDPAFAGRFDREGQLLARLHHPNIVAVHDSGAAGDFFYLLMEYVEGVNLRQAMRSSRFTPAQALAIIPHICDALQFAHDEGVLHRDIKPENILLDARGRVKLVDFGIAKLMGATADPGGIDRPLDDPTLNLTQSGATLGTPSYMAPEQRDTPSNVDHRADIYSLGVVFYELLTGELPAGSFAPPSTKSETDPRIDAIVQQALEKERTRRQNSAGEMKTQVETVASQPTPPELKEHQLLHLQGFTKFQSLTALRIAQVGCIGFLGFLGLIPGLHALRALFGLFGLLGVAYVIEVFARRKTIGIHGIVRGGIGLIVGISIAWILARSPWLRQTDSPIPPSLFEMTGGTFGPVIERDLTLGNTPHSFYSLDRSAYVPGPKDFTPPDGTTSGEDDPAIPKMYRWLTDNDIDFLTMRSNGSPGLVLSDMVISSCDESAFDHSSSRGISGDGGFRSALQAQFRPNLYKPLTGNNGGMITLLFQTRYRRIGMVQVTGVTSNPPGIHIRYKMIQAPESTPVTSSPESTPQVAAFVAERAAPLYVPRWSRMLSLFSLLGLFVTASLVEIFVRRTSVGIETEKNANPWRVYTGALLKVLPLGLAWGLCWLLLLPKLSEIIANQAASAGATSAIPLQRLVFTLFNPSAPAFLLLLCLLIVLADFLPAWKSRRPTMIKLLVIAFNALALVSLIALATLAIVTITVPHQPATVSALPAAPIPSSSPSTVSQSKRQRFEPVTGLADKTNWGIYDKPSIWNPDGWAIVARMTLGGVVNAQLPGESNDFCRIKLAAGNDDAITVKIEDLKNNSTMTLTLNRDQLAELTINGVGYGISYCGINVANDQPDTTPFAFIVVTHVDLPPRSSAPALSPIRTLIIHPADPNSRAVNLATGQYIRAGSGQDIEFGPGYEDLISGRGADLYFQDQSPPGVLIALDMHLCTGFYPQAGSPPAPPLDALTGDDLLKALQRFESWRADRESKGQGFGLRSRIAHVTGTNLYFFTTRNNISGVLQIAAVTATPPAITINYRLLAGASPLSNAPDPAAAADSQAAATELIHILDAISAARMDISDTSLRYGDQHPKMILLRSKLAALQTQADALRARIRKDTAPGDPDPIPAIEAKAATSELATTLAEVTATQVAISDASQHYGPQHPRMILLQSKLTALQAQADALQASIRQATPPATLPAPAPAPR
jgi:tRNA A-37 threonylcarbamoyl transferase component Bud32